MMTATEFSLETQRLRRKMIFLACRYVGEDAEDVVQDAVMKAWQSLPGFRGEAQFATWLHRIVVTSALNYLAVQRRRPQPSMDVAEIELHDDESPEQIALGVALAGRIDDAVCHMSASLRETWELAELTSQSDQDVADILGVPVGTVRSRVNRARTILGEAIAA